MSHNVFCKYPWMNNISDNVAPISFTPVRNRCAKPVARAAACVNCIRNRLLLHFRDLIMKPVKL